MEDSLDAFPWGPDETEGLDDESFEAMMAANDPDTDPLQQLVSSDSLGSPEPSPAAVVNPDESDTQAHPEESMALAAYTIASKASMPNLTTEMMDARIAYLQRPG